MKIGIHMDNITEQKIIKLKKNGNIIQLFVNNSVQKIKQLLMKYKLKSLVHISYTINLSRNWDKYSWWILQFINEIEFAYLIRSEYVVIHLGKQLELTLEEAINNMINALIYIHMQTLEYKNVKILIETSSGQGSEIGYNFKELAQIYNKLKYLNRFNICLDTAHLYVSGYNLNNFDKVMNEFQEYFNLDDIKVVHLNNTKKELGSKIDRHSNLEDGNINNIAHIAYYFIKLDKWIILETPQKKIYEDLEMISDSI